ncbi:cytochrome P450 [Nonomuraea sp. NPDC046802]|uniref:cytochrome P450 n=1 Tax=Nonomuraea sp. NPDC046802 TaxID=3154919 RepID=UPI0033C37C34
MTQDSGSRPVSLPTERDTPFDPPRELRELAAKGPLHPMAYPSGHIGWLVTGHAVARAVLADPRFSARQELRHMPVEHVSADLLRQPAPPGWFLRHDPPDHTRYRRLLTGQFTVRKINRLIPRIERITEDHLDAMEKAGSPVDLVEHFALPIPSLVICELLGVPYENREEFQRNTAELLKLDGDKEGKNAARDGLTSFFTGLIAAKRAEPGDDLISGLIADGELDDTELFSIGLLLLIAGHETTANMLAIGTWALLRHPEQLAALKADPGLVDGAVEELLRHIAIIQFGAQRAALEDVEIEGVTIKKGQTVTISIPMANRDPGRFDDPDTLDLGKEAGGHLAFGHGVHQCIGQQLARIEMRIAYPALFRRFPGLALAVPDEEIRLRTDMAIYGVHRLPVVLG